MGITIDKSFSEFVNENMNGDRAPDKGKKRGDFNNIEAPEVFRGYGDVVVMNEKGEMLLLKRSATDTLEPNKWLYAGGKLELNEDSGDGAYREMVEESGVVVDRNKMFYICDHDHGDGSVSYLYGAMWNGTKPTLSNEHSEWKFFAKNELPEIAFGSDDFVKEIFAKFKKAHKNYKDSFKNS